MTNQDALLQIKERQLQNAMTKIEENVRLSIHHYSVELNIPAQELHEAWTAHSYEKKNASA